MVPLVIDICNCTHERAQDDFGMVFKEINLKQKIRFKESSFISMGNLNEKSDIPVPQGAGISMLD